MDNTNQVICPLCNNNSFSIKYEAAYTYSYLLDADAPGLKNREEFLPFMFDKREQKDSTQYVECNTCGAKYPCYFNQWDKEIGIKELQETVNLNNLVSRKD